MSMIFDGSSTETSGASSSLSLMTGARFVDRGVQPNSGSGTPFSMCVGVRMLGDLERVNPMKRSWLHGDFFPMYRDILVAFVLSV